MDGGGGVFCEESNAIIVNNVITWNSAGLTGGGIHCHFHGFSEIPTITDNTIMWNFAGDKGGGVFCVQSRPVIADNLIAYNTAMRMGAGIHSRYASPSISHNSITDNEASSGGAGIYFYGQYFCEATVNHNNLLNTTKYEIYLDNDTLDIDATNNWWGTTNTDSIDARVYDYYDDIALGRVLYSPILTFPTMGEPDYVYSVVLKSDSTYTIDLAEELWIGAKMYIQLEGEDSDSICVNQTTVTITSDSTDILGIRVVLTETDSISGIFRGTALIDSVSIEDVSIGATVGETITITSDVDSTKFTTVGVVEAGIKGSDTIGTPKALFLSQNYPNPFNPVTEIRYALPRDCWVRLEVYSVLGRKVTSLVDGKQKAGYKIARWEAGSFSSGSYFYRLEAGDFVETRKMVLLK